MSEISQDQFSMCLISIFAKPGKCPTTNLYLPLLSIFNHGTSYASFWLRSKTELQSFFAFAYWFLQEGRISGSNYRYSLKFAAGPKRSCSILGHRHLWLLICSTLLLAAVTLNEMWFGFSPCSHQWLNIWTSAAPWSAATCGGWSSNAPFHSQSCA